MTKKRPLKLAIIPTDPWKWDIFVLHGPHDAFEDYARKTFKVSIDAAGIGHTYMQEGLPVLIWVNDIGDIPVLVHELMHAIFGILSSRGLTHTPESEEAYTYTMGDVLGRVLKHTNWRKVA